MWVHPLLEKLPFLHGKTVGFGNDWDDIHNLAKLLHDNDVNRPKGVTAGVDEVQRAVDPRVLDVSVAHGSQLLAQVCAVLVLDILNDRVPARMVVKIQSRISLHEV